ncbi:metallophosphoesterase [Paraburkholderia sp. C35]|uniref:metallophosphoesterase family protein n=1 Tax=Paraburkholderia sp. C35 TaxID=2126993 RepID=UPI000D699ECE|nr:metallophosphoesterase [Paraburkholderia sp. C35]
MDKAARYLLRFRDHGAHPILEHKKIIDEHETCWWGWWKRPYESPNLEFWADICSEIDRVGHIYIALADLDETDVGFNNVYFARAIKAIVPSELQDEPAEVPEDDRETRVAPYYDSHAPSYAWLKFDDITKPQKFFGLYSYAVAPDLLNVDKKSVKLLEGKVINDAQELACMNVSMWSIRKKEPGDLEKELLFVFGNNGPVTPTSQNIIHCVGDTILHISDPHFSVDSHRAQHVWRLESEDSRNPPAGVGKTSMADAIIQSLKNSNVKVGLVVATGDFTFKSHPDEFEEAARSIRKILRFLQLEEDRLIIVPGNHDIAWTEDKPIRGNKELVVRVAGDDANREYCSFYEKLLGHPPSDHLSMGRRYAFPAGMVVEICGLNSNSIATGKKFLAGMGVINEQAFGDVAINLGWNSMSSSALRIIAVHHHLAVTENYEEKSDYLRGYGLAVNAVRVQRQAVQYGVQLALHGHKHRAFVWRSTVYELPEERNEIVEPSDLSILGAGSAGSVETEAKSTYFNLIKVCASKLSVGIYSSRETGEFRRIARYEADYRMSSGRLLLDQWRQLPPRATTPL